MDKMISYCGLICSECGAYLATQNDDKQKRKEVAKQWSVQYNTDIKPEDINCGGCTKNSVHFGHCNVCEIRKCAMQKEVINCAHCDEYACEKLEGLFKMAPDCEKQLDEIKAGL